MHIAVQCIDGSVRLLVGEANTFYTEGIADLAEDYFFKDELIQGRVEYCYEGSYVTLCNDFWSNAHASVVCGELGFSHYGT